MDHRILLTTPSLGSEGTSQSADSVGAVFDLIGLSSAQVLEGEAPAREIAAACRAALVHAPTGEDFGPNGPHSDWYGVRGLLRMAEGAGPDGLITWAHE